MNIGEPYDAENDEIERLSTVTFDRTLVTDEDLALLHHLNECRPWANPRNALLAAILRELRLLREQGEN